MKQQEKQKKKCNSYGSALMIEDGKLNYEDIAMYTELTLEEVEKIALEKKSA